MNAVTLRGKAQMLLMALALGLSIPATGTAQDRVDQGQLAAALTGGSKRQRVEAIHAIRRIPARERGPAIRSALVQEVHRHHRNLVARRGALRAGHPLPPVADHGEYLFSLLELLIQNQDPADIEALVLFISSGNRVTNALAEFGELAVGAVLEVAASSASRLEEVSSALETLERMLNQTTPHPLSATSKMRIRDVAKLRLQGTQDHIVVRHAMQLAIATGDPALRHRVEVLARDPSAVGALGINDSRHVARVQNDAVRALQGSR